jgi:hypothetical protein
MWNYGYNGCAQAGHADTLGCFCRGLENLRVYRIRGKPRPSVVLFPQSFQQFQYLLFGFRYDNFVEGKVEFIRVGY